MELKTTKSIDADPTIHKLFYHSMSRVPTVQMIRFDAMHPQKSCASCRMSAIAKNIEKYLKKMI